ncbi:vacuolar protein sorting-associated protein 35b [Quercus suber]|uniref:Vacuolar protein sorting-associated protein 35b n=1 Tax=Quercus suber TaxID=58331 RepID=A0AAW0KCI9_QUESU
MSGMTGIVDYAHYDDMKYAVFTQMHSSLVQRLSLEKVIEVSTTHINSFLSSFLKQNHNPQVEVLFELIKGLIKDLDGTAADELDEEDFNKEQNSVAQLIHVLYNDDPEELLKLIRQLQGQDGDVAGEEVLATPKKIFQILNEFLYKSRLYSIHDICIKAASKALAVSQAKASLKNEEHIRSNLARSRSQKRSRHGSLEMCTKSHFLDFAKTLSQFDFSSLSPRFSFLLVLFSLEMVNYTRTNTHRFSSLD